MIFSPARKGAYVLLLAAVLPFGLLSFFNHPFMDDYYNAANARRLGLWAAQQDLYLHWSGRYFSSLLVTAANPMQLDWYNGLRVTPLLFLMAALGTFYLGGRALMLPRRAALAVAALVLVWYVHLIPELYSAFYWFTGATVYLLAGLATLLVFIASARARQSTTASGRRGWQLTALLGVVAAAASNEMSFAHLLLGATLQLTWAVWQRTGWHWWALVLLVTVGAGIPMLMAPGNFVRLGFEFSPNLMRTDPGAALLQGPGVALDYTWRFLKQSGLALRLGLLTVVWLGLVAGWQQAGGKLPTGLRLPWYLGLLGWLAVLWLTMLLFQLTTARFPPPRAENGLWLALLPAWLLLCVAAWTALYPAGAPAWLAKLKAPASVGGLLYLAGLLLLASPRHAWQELWLNARSFDEQMLAREKELRGAGSWGKGNLVLAPIKDIKPRHVLISGWDLSTNPGHYVNTETALYFGLESVRIDERQLPLADPDFHNQQP
jgi:hypothetical protein